uniref:Secreted protein n=2 Tax=Acrobeloides nanus TaxID=290746 RepID=A0A914E5J7_9BILA
MENFAKFIFVANSLIFTLLPTRAVLYQNAVVAAVVSPSLSPSSPDQCSNELYDGFSEGPLVPCDFLDTRWIICEKVDRLEISNTTKDCPYFGSKEGKFARVNVTCTVLPCIECAGPRSFPREVPCIKYTGHYFLTTLLYSIFLGIFAVDRFSLGYSAIAVGKLMTLGGLGVWWIIDIILLINGNLTPADDSQWEPYF